MRFAQIISATGVFGWSFVLIWCLGALIGWSAGPAYLILLSPVSYGLDECMLKAAFRRRRRLHTTDGYAVDVLGRRLSQYSFPSAHATAAGTAIGLAVRLPLLCTLFTVLGIVICRARYVLGAHDRRDLIGGIAIGLFIGGAVSVVT